MNEATPADPLSGLPQIFVHSCFPKCLVSCQTTIVPQPSAAFPLDHISSLRPLFSNEPKLQAVVKYSSCAGQAFQGVTPQSEGASGCDEALDVGLGWPWAGGEDPRPGSTLFPEESSGYNCTWLKFRVTKSKTLGNPYGQSLSPQVDTWHQ